MYKKTLPSYIYTLMQWQTLHHVLPKIEIASLVGIKLILLMIETP